MKEQDASIDEPLSVSRELGVRFSENDANPWGLALAGPTEVVGVSSRGATETIPRFLRKIGSSVAFRHVRSKEIAFDLYEEVLTEALKRRLTIGIGVDCASLYNQPIRSFLHLFRVVSYRLGEVILFDDAHEVQPPEQSRPWIEVARASLAANDGFWFLRPPEDLTLPYTLPFPRGIAQ
jgi:hypothetical protein